MTAARGQGLRGDAVRNHERIVVAAGRAFEEDGPAATLEDVAKRAGVGVATVYRRFRNRDQLVRAVFEHILTIVIEPITMVESDDPWCDLTEALEATVELVARNQVALALAREIDAIDVNGLQRYVKAADRLVGRAIDAGVVRPDLMGRDLAAVIVMALATAHPGDPEGADRKRYLALLIDGLRPAPADLPPPSTSPILPDSSS
ncbi:TetR/AcrR family transcriptional regulator [Amycolatopsis sp. NBC_00355]|uniref:TetR/AcrR family transcriptional regulator n=1 Tax=Amycolatopsis sp. NBC_00355 TaxID=2975957 RepID=UPI002E26D07A